MPKPTRFAGLDVHRDTIVVALLGPEGPTLDLRVLPHDLRKVKSYFAKVSRGHVVQACYEAGGCGYGLKRALDAAGVPCDVIAPSLIPRRPGDRVKTDRRDAELLARALRAGQLTAVHTPSEEEERVRSLVRARQGLQRDLHVCQQRILKFLLLRGFAFRLGKNWGTRFMSWLGSLEWEGADRLVMETHLAQRTLLLQLRDGLDREVERVSVDETFWARGAVARLRCLHGVDTLSAMTLATEIVDASRFASPRHLMNFVGLTPSEHSSGGTVRQGAISKAGNPRLRRILVEAAWHYQFPPRRQPSPRWEGQAPEVVAYAQKAHARLHVRFRRLHVRKKSNVAVTAIARELVGFVWALLRDEPELLRARPTTPRADFRRRRGTTGGILVAPMRQG